MLNGEIARSDKLANAMAAVMQRINGPVKEVSLSIDSHLVFQIPLGPVADYFGVGWAANFDSLPKNSRTLVLQDTQAIQLTQQLIGQQGIELPLPIHHAFVMYVVAASYGTSQRGEVKAEKNDHATASGALLLVGCPRKEVRSREQLLTNLHLRLQVLEPRINAALRAIALIDPGLGERLFDPVWIWISLENSQATVQLVQGDQRLEGLANLTPSALPTYLNDCIGWAGVALRDIVVSYASAVKDIQQLEQARLMAAIEEIAGPLGVSVNPISFLPQPMEFFARSMSDSNLARATVSESRTDDFIAGAGDCDCDCAGESGQQDWLVALGLAWGLINNPPQLELKNMNIVRTKHEHR